MWTGKCIGVGVNRQVISVNGSFCGVNHSALV